ncbi:Spy/CpxP family protein refolding chaperone [Aquisalimonas lutea]|nr:Spy/CpxP family protein refolding chaperone [Aquisalimonas lutea]MDN3519045.1 Spy/CpxP family protein refolding chaperone [Aquisalimonas lutea]
MHGSGAGVGVMHGGGMGPSGPGMRGHMGMMGSLELNDEQQAQLREFRSEYRQERFARMADMLDLRDEMHALMAQQRPDPEAVRELHGRMADLHSNMMADRVRMRNAIQHMLTDEQRQHMREHRQEGRGMPGDGGHRGQQQGHHGSQNR